MLEDVNCIRYDYSQNEDIDKTIRELEGNDTIISLNNGYMYKLQKYFSKVEVVNFKLYFLILSKRDTYSVDRGGEICFVGNLNKATFLEKVSLNRYKMRLYGSFNKNFASKFKKTRN